MKYLMEYTRNSIYPILQRGKAVLKAQYLNIMLLPITTGVMAFPL